ncbi:hypothetical protein NC652_001662 [Populus alba x Populus x berolinensis]|nr:hypothetical protein NC652_001662 [Populus alba x Populus x berolinensis]
MQSIPLDMCKAILTDIGSGSCGFNSYCSIQENRKPTCACPPGYVFLDPNNSLGGCKPTLPQGCGLDDGRGDPEELYEIRQFDNVNWPLNDYESLSPYNQTQCEKSCLYDCSCAVAIFDGRICWKKRLPLSNVVTFLILFRRRERKVKKVGSDSSIYFSTLRSFTYEELEEATDGFMEELGRGSFGIVYKGFMRSSSGNAIAVKKLDKLAQEREREFRTEVSAIGKTHHKNLVRLFGYCDEGSHRLLIYEFMSNGTLANFLFTLPRPDWHQRVKIALGVARGLLYLHEECEFPIIHCDIKPQNILLDDSFSSRISDFGLAKLLLSNQTRTRTMIRGTRGYVAPEWFRNVPVTAKVDVYSFGVVLLEIICSRRSVVMDLEEEEERAILTDWAYDCYIGGRIYHLVDNDKVAMDDKERLKKWVEVSLWCIQEEPSKRPTMKMVLEMLEGFLDVPSLLSLFPLGSNGELSRI